MSARLSFLCVVGRSIRAQRLRWAKDLACACSLSCRLTRVEQAFALMEAVHMLLGEQTRSDPANCEIFSVFTRKLACGHDCRPCQKAPRAGRLCWPVSDGAFSCLGARNPLRLTFETKNGHALRKAPWCRQWLDGSARCASPRLKTHQYGYSADRIKAVAEKPTAIYGDSKSTLKRQLVIALRSLPARV